MQNINVPDLLKSCIITTASLANTLSDMTNGQQVMPEEHYPALYNRYQHFLTKQIIIPRTREELREVNRKFIQIIIDECNNSEEDKTND